MSFTLARPELKAGFYVPVRLRVVDTLTIVSGVPAVVLMIAVCMVSLRWADRLGLGVIWRNEFAFYAYVMVVVLVAGWTAGSAAVAVLRVLFRLAGMMTRDESRSFPLRADKKRVDPWPESWLRPCEVDRLDNG